MGEAYYKILYIKLDVYCYLGGINFVKNTVNHISVKYRDFGISYVYFWRELCYSHVQSVIVVFKVDLLFITV